MALFGAGHERHLEEWRLGLTFHGAVGDVQFDLRHDALDPQEWSLHRIISEPMPGNPRFEIETAYVDTEWLGGTFKGVLAEDRQRKASEGVTFLRPGDLVLAERVEIERNGDPLSQAVDNDRATVHLVVRRAAGGEEAIPALTLSRKGQRPNDLLPDYWWFELLADRVPHVAIGDDHRGELLASAERVRELQSEVERLLSADCDGVTGLLAFARTAPLFSLIGAAARFGYRLGAEERQILEPLAVRSVARSRQSREAASYEKRPEWREFAKEYWSKWPSASANRVATECADKHGGDVRNIAKAIKHLRPAQSSAGAGSAAPS